MSKPDTWMPWYIGDYLADTARLTTEGHGAYMLLMADYWTSGQALPDDDEQLAAITKTDEKKWRKLRPILEHFFYIFHGLWIHKRIEEELEKALKNVAARSAAGKTGANARWQSHSNRIADAMANGQQNDTPSPSPSPKERKKDAAPSGARDLKAVVFGGGLTWLQAKTGKPADALRSLLGRWVRDYGEPTVISALSAAQSHNPIEPIAWITKALAERGETEPKKSTFGSPGFA